MPALPAVPIPPRAISYPRQWIYFVQGDDGGPVKIGRTGNRPQQRVEMLQSGYPFGRLRVVGLILGVHATEKELHARFSASRMRGEWFSLTPDLLQFLTKLPAVELAASEVRA